MNLKKPTIFFVFLFSLLPLISVLGAEPTETNGRAEFFLAKNDDYFQKLGIVKPSEPLKSIDFTINSLGGDAVKLSDFKAVDIQEDEKKVKSFMKKYGIDFPVFLDSSGAIAQNYAVSGIPTTYIIDPNGGIVGRAVGPRPWNSEDSLNFMRSLMD